MALNFKFEYRLYLEGDIIIKQGDMNDYFYYIHEGLAEVFMESHDFLYFDYKHVRTFINSSKTKNEEEQMQDPDQSDFGLDNSMISQRPSFSIPEIVYTSPLTTEQRFKRKSSN